ncbi:MAG: carbonic anhydrase [Gemmatimonadales bacterium]|nr:MAG: carbonic anhydrase [Gemmatimonadales bacterium]
MPRNLLEGLTRFRSEYFPQHAEEYRRLVSEGQHPRTLFIGCADSRVVPDVLTDTAPGDLFVVRNVGNLVPPFELESERHHGVTAAIEYAVEILEVEEIIICGHSHCGAIRSVYEPPPGSLAHLSRWLDLAAPARVEHDGPLTEEVLRKTERRSIVIQLDRLMEFPAVRRRVEAGTLKLQGWHYLIETGEVQILDIERGEFVPHE